MDLRKLKTLIDLVSESNVSELEITEAEGKVRIVKGGPAYVQPVQQAMGMQQLAAQPANGVAPAAPAAARVMPGGFGKDVGDPWHSLSDEVRFAKSIGWQVVMPSNARDAVGLLRSAMRSLNPTIFFEHRSLLMTSDGSARYPGDDYVVPIGRAHRIAEGTGITVVTWGAMVHRCADAARLHPDGIVELIDLRSIAPWDRGMVLESVTKTGRCLIVHEDTQTAGFGAEIAATIATPSANAIGTLRCASRISPATKFNCCQPPKLNEIGTSAAARPRVTALTAPTAAPPDTPNRYGSASGLRMRTTCTPAKRPSIISSTRVTFCPAMSAAVIEPNSFDSSPAFAWNVREIPSSFDARRFDALGTGPRPRPGQLAGAHAAAPAVAGVGIVQRFLREEWIDAPVTPGNPAMRSLNTALFAFTSCLPSRSVRKPRRSPPQRHLSPPGHFRRQYLLRQKSWHE